MPSIQTFLKVGVSLLPVFVFLWALVFLDSYKLVRFRSILFAIGLGVVAATASWVLNWVVLENVRIELAVFQKYVAPLIEEFLKSAYIIYLLRSRRVGFMVDAAIFGAAIGAGFAFLENIYYLQSLTTANLPVWVIRGFGTAIMHSGTTSLFAIITKNLSDRSGKIRIGSMVPGFALAVVVHSLFNHLLLSPILSTLVIVVAMPILMMIVFSRSEKATREWLGIGFDTDVQILEMITSGEIADSNIGRYLTSLRDRFSGEVVADMLCLLRIYLELAIQAKGILLARQSGLEITPSTEIREKLNELQYLRKSIGPVGLLALSPFLHTSHRDLWQLTLLDTN